MRPFLEKVAAETREYVQALLDENQRLSKLVAELDNRNREFTERYVEIEQQNTNLANLYVASYQLNGTLERDRVVAAIQEIVINLIGSEELAIWQIEEELDSLTLIGSFGINAREWAGVPLGSGIVGHVACSGQRYVVTESDTRPFGREQHLTACIPLKLDDKVIGVIGIFRLLQQKQGLEPVDFELFDLLCSHAATALYCTREAVQ
ncbi:MAG TPA: GAF domain-containing protein [Thermoanaerobaculia bacterium]|jgi:nitrate/nitrite-specific signal transduction histidine kinase